ncbi:hypothetical protein EW146_g7100 [Bondarzewia mesenterica]|uniref:C2H2-type domain-containing protein n=1 Tax=Bondarzewia mesenterica TaxID=1095465 RepID=A0A4S4LMC1_9AGAM|nr:hypothetical protein EW146_g7100 [Bondarzewia mesenterica]
MAFRFLPTLQTPICVNADIFQNVRQYTPLFQDTMNTYNINIDFPNHPSPALPDMDWNIGSHMNTAAEFTDQEWTYIQSLTQEWRRTHNTNLWSNINSTRAGSIPSPPAVPSNYGVPPSVDSAFGASTDYSNAQATSPSTTPSPFVFAMPIVHNPMMPAVGYPSITFAPMEVPPPTRRATGKRKQREEEAPSESKRPVEYIWTASERPTNRTMKRQRTTVHRRRVTETLPSNNSTTGNHASGDSVLTGNGILAVSSQTAGPSGSQNTEDEVEESGASAKAYEELQDRAVAALKKDNADRKWPCTMPGCDKRFRRQQEAQRHITDTKEHRHPQCEGKHVCEDCGKKFGRRDSMARHQKSGACGRLRKKAAALIGV